MTEAEWLISTDPKPMLRYLIGTNAERVMDVRAFPNCKGSDRKMRLFACACYARIDHLVRHFTSKNAVDTAEQFADGLVSLGEMQLARDSLQPEIDGLEWRWRASTGGERTTLQPTHDALALAWQVVRAEAPKAAYYASSNANLAVAALVNPGAPKSDNRLQKCQRDEMRAQADLLRCIFGNLFRSLTIDHSTLSCDLISLAQFIYKERLFERLPELAAALERAGCTHKDFLDHCRGSGFHARGCWVVDLILGKG